MKFVLVSPFTPPLVGGLETVCLRLATWLAAAGHAAGHDVSIVGRFAASRPGLWGRLLGHETVRRFECQGIPITILPALGGGIVTTALMWSRRSLPGALALQSRGLGKPLADHCAGADHVHYLGTGHCPVEERVAGDAASFRARYGIRGPLVLFLGRKTVAKGVARLLAA